MKFVIYTPHYSEKIGGVIVLYELAATLKTLGHEALIWNYTVPHPNEYTPQHNNSKIVGDFSIPLGIGLVDRNCPHQHKHATVADINDSIVIYPDSATGNPLGASRVARWFLYYPGWKAEVMSIGRDDLLLFFLKDYIPKFIDATQVMSLTIHALRHDLYSAPTTPAKRSGVGYIVHKGSSEDLIHHPSGAIRLDTLPHIEIAKLLRQLEYVVSYDLDTTYNVYALLSGCDIVIAPNAVGIKKSLESNTYSSVIHRAYANSTTDIFRARLHREDAISKLKSVNDNNIEEANRFVSACIRKWSTN